MKARAQLTAALLVCTATAAVSAATFTVTTTADNGPGTLRWAIEQANATPGFDTIAFNIPVAPYTLQPLTPLPPITDPVAIDGTTQPGFLGTPIVHLDGALAGPGANGLLIVSGSSLVRGLVITRFHLSGIRLEGTWASPNGTNRILGNYIGLMPDGLTPAGNGIETSPEYPAHAGILAFHSDGNVIGSPEPGQANVISGNKWNINLEWSARTTVQYNKIGTDATGTRALSNPTGIIPPEGLVGYHYAGGIKAEYAPDTVIRNNLISGNTTEPLGFWQQACGIFCSWECHRTRVESNFIGTDLSGRMPLPNQWGAWVVGDDCVIAHNLISGNVLIGLFATGLRHRIENNLIGTDITGQTALGNGLVGLQLYFGHQALVRRNVISANGYRGISVTADDVAIVGNYIGTDSTGTKALPYQHEGVFVFNPNVRIGGTNDADRNIISGNDTGIRLMSSGGRVQGNFVGTDVSATVALPNGVGMYLSDCAQSNLIGGTSANARNVISGNARHGILVLHTETFGNRIQGNYIGTDRTGLSPLPNADGIAIGAGAHDNTIGGEETGAGNVVAFNVHCGIGVGHAPWEAGPYAVRNRILGNSIHSNAGAEDHPVYGIFLTMPYIRWEMIENDPLDMDEGVNKLQNFPIIQNASSTPTGTRVQGFIHSTPQTTFRIELFANRECDASGYGEGERFLGATDVTTDQNGNGRIDVWLPVSVPVGWIITATATDPEGNTSAFSPCGQPVVQGDAEPPVIHCPGEIRVHCSPDPLVPVTFAVSASDGVDPSPLVTCDPPSGSGFPVGEVVVTCTASDAAGNVAACSFKVIRAPLEFDGFLPPIGGSDATGGSFFAPLQTFKFGSTIPVKFKAFCGGTPVVAGVHRLQVVKFSDATTAAEPIDATPQDAATSGNQFVYSDGVWRFNLDTRQSGMSKGIWQLVATLSDGSQHRAWIQLK
ncbi:MAG: right-handed parallel beta-helix repeat-containing protein [Thermogemmata sp.]|jgi:hypothetical protein|uniref:HYR domain-containing protein n=1 Tax=Limisphaera sp. VF-2 TaxID=3400418 RepID=UPI001766C28A